MAAEQKKDGGAGRPVLRRLVREDAGELTWLGRIALLALGGVGGLLLVRLGFVPTLEYASASMGGGAPSGAGAALSLSLSALLLLAPIGAVLWWIRTDDKKHEFRGAQRLLARTQVDEAFRLLMEASPPARGVGLYRLHQLRRAGLIDEQEYEGRLSVVRSWELAGTMTLVAPALDFRGVNLNGANLEGAHLYRSDLADANLRGARLYRARLDSANLEGANLRGAVLSHANLSGARLQGADFTGAKTDGLKLQGADTTDAKGLAAAEG